MASSFIIKAATLALLCFALTCAKPNPDGENELTEPENPPPSEQPSTVSVETKSTGTIEDRQKLIHDLLSGYDPRNYPTNFTSNFGLALQKFDVDPAAGTVTADVWLRQSWIDPRLKFNPEEYGGTKSIRLSVDNIWRPDILLYNTAGGPHGQQCIDTHSIIFPNGLVLWIPPCSITAICNLTLDTHPYEEQICKLKFGSWTFDGYSMDLQLFQSSVDELEYFERNPDWEITNLVAERKSKTYPCCAEPYLTIEYDLSFRRRRV